jgi:hypothetical protein
MTVLAKGATRRLGFWPYILGVFMCLAVPAGQALAEQGIGISPTSQTPTIAPGGTFSGQMTVINDGSIAVRYQIYATDYAVRGNDYQGVFINSGSSANIAARSWFKVPSGTFTVGPQQEKNFPYTVTVPKTATVGGHYATIFIQTIPPPSAQGTLIKRVDRIGSLFYMTVSGALVRQGNLLPLQVAWFQSSSPLKADVLLTNTGNVHYLAQGTGTLSTPFGKTGTSVPFTGEILPSTTRQFTLSLAAASDIGIYKVSVNVNYLGRTTVLSHWVLLVPKLTFIIVSATILLLLVLGFWKLIQKAKRPNQEN